MTKRLLILILVNLFFYNLSSAQFHASEKKVKKSEISQDIKNYVHENHHGDPVKYYKVVTDDDSILYEAKVKSSNGKINLLFSSDGKYLSTDSEVHYLEVEEVTRVTINAYLTERFSSFEVTHCRDLRMEHKKVYEIDVIAKKTKYRFKFKKDGTLIDGKEIPQKSIDLIFN